MKALKRLCRQAVLQAGDVFGFCLMVTLLGEAMRAYGHWPFIISTGRIVYHAGIDLGATSVLLWFVRFVWKLMPEQTSVGAAFVVVVGAYFFFEFAPLALVSVVTSGGSWSTVEAAAWDRGGHGFAADLVGTVRFACQAVSLLFLVGRTSLLRYQLPWERASAEAQSLMTTWLATGATIMTWICIVLLHFAGGPLSPYRIGPVAVGALGAALLVAPMYKFVARSCWRHGFVAAFDPTRWRAAWASVRREIKRGYADAAEPAESRTGGDSD